LPGGTRPSARRGQEVEDDELLGAAELQYPKPGATPTITEYSTTDVREVTLDDLTLVSKVIDTPTQSGANVVQRLQYQLKNPAAVRAQALRQAAEQARSSTDAIAAGLGVTPPTPLEVGMIEVSLTVMLSVEIAQ
jgi:uncharacterized protein YggE